MDKNKDKRKPGPWPDGVDDVELERALAQVPPYRLLEAFKRLWGDKDHPVADSPWTKLPAQPVGENPKRAVKMDCPRCKKKYKLKEPWYVLLRNFYYRPPDQRRFRIGQCSCCGAGYWCEVDG